MSEVAKTYNTEGTASRYFLDGVSVIFPPIQADEAWVDFNRRGIRLKHAREFAASIVAICDEIERTEK